MKLNNLAEELSKVKSVVITGHERPDGDCTGSCLATYNYIKDNFKDIDVDIYLESIPGIFRFLKNADKIDSEFLKEKTYDLAISQDCGDIERLGPAKKYFESAKMTINIDHHISNTEFGQLNYVFPKASSTSELIFELIGEEAVTKEIAECIYLGIVHDTGIFQYSSTSRKTMEIAGFLMETGIDFTKIIDDTYYAKTYSQNQILGKALLESILLFDGQCIMTAVKYKDMKFYGVMPKHLEGIINQLRVTKDVEVAVLFYELKSHEYKVSMRSNGHVNVSKIAAHFGGGGHIKAAGCSLNGTLREVQKSILGQIEKQLTQENHSD